MSSWPESTSKWQARFSPISLLDLSLPKPLTEGGKARGVGSDKHRGNTGLKTGLPKELSPKRHDGGACLLLGHPLRS